MFRGKDSGLPIDTPDGRDPRPEPRRKYTPDEALALAREQGYQAFELFNWRDPGEWAGYFEAKKKYGLECACIAANKGVRAPGCGLTNPAEREGFLQVLTSPIEAAKKIGARMLVVLTGFEREGVSREEQLSSCVAGLRAAAPILEKAGMTAILEPVNTRVTRPGYFLPSAREGFGILRRVDSPNVKLLFDIYHVQVSDGDIIPQIRENIDRIGHFHIGDHPGRMQPGTGEINYRNVFRAIYELQEAGKFTGYAALEYHPSVPLPQTMAEVRQLANFG
jgi:hydroxypyruvate isomerase